MQSKIAYYNKEIVLVATSLIAFMVCIDFSIVNTTIPAIQRDLAANMNQSQWLMAGFTLTAGTFFITSGRLGDLIGHRKMLFIGAFGFAITSLFAGLAHTPLWLIAMRLCQGVLSAFSLPASMAIIANTFPVEQRGRALGFFNSAAGVGLAAGPTVGSLIEIFLNWRWIFFINIPVIAIALILAVVAIKESKSSKVSIDWLGTILMTIMIGALLFVISQVSYYGWHRLVMAAVAVFIVSLILLIIIEKRSEEPVVPFKLFMNRGFILGTVIFFATVGCCWSVMFIMPIYLHNQMGFSIEGAGLLLFVMTFMTILAPPVAGHWFDKKSKRIAAHTTLLLSFIGLLLFSMMQLHGPLWLIIAAFIIFGLAWGAGNGISIPFALAEASADESPGMIAGGLICALYMFGIFSLTVFMAIFHYGMHLSVISRLHNAFYFLLFCVIICWLIAAVHLRKL